MDLCGEWSSMEFALLLWGGSLNLLVVGLTIFVGVWFVGGRGDNTELCGDEKLEVKYPNLTGTGINKFDHA